VKKHSCYERGGMACWKIKKDPDILHPEILENTFKLYVSERFLHLDDTLFPWSFLTSNLKRGGPLIGHKEFNWSFQ